MIFFVQLKNHQIPIGLHVKDEFSNYKTIVIVRWWGMYAWKRGNNDYLNYHLYVMCKGNMARQRQFFFSSFLSYHFLWRRYVIKIRFGAEVRAGASFSCTTNVRQIGWTSLSSPRIRRRRRKASRWCTMIITTVIIYTAWAGQQRGTRAGNNNNNN